MSSLSPTRFERVRKDLLHVSLRQVTEDPEPGQPANLARRAASFTKNRRDLDNYQAWKAAERVAADERKDNALRVKLNGLAAENRLQTPSRAEREVTNETARPLGADGFIPPAPRSRPVQPAASRQRFPGTNKSLITSVPHAASHGVPIPSSMPSSTSRLPAAQLDSRELAAAETGDNSRLVDRTRRKQIHVTAAFSRTKSTVTQNSPTKSPAEKQPGGHDDARSDTLEDDGTERSPPIRNRSPVKLRSTAKIRRLIPDSEDDDISDDGGSATHGLASSSPSRTRTELDPAHLQFGQGHFSTAASTLLSRVTDRHKCTRKHFRIKRIIGKQVIDGDTYYDVRWKRSWVPSHLIRSENGQDHFIEIDGKGWYIKEVIKSKMKKGIHKQLVRWADDTQEPLRHLGKALGAIAAFEKMPKLKRRVVTFDESLLDTRTILPQSEKHFREAQLHLAKKWPIIEPRNDIDLLPALKQIILEDPDHPRNDKLIHRKTHFRLLDQRQVRPLRWNEAYILSGRHYECSLPRRNALLLQVVGDTEGNTCCERCLSSTSPFAECVMDTSDEDPWFNGGCANCGAFEANTTCLHHNVGREDSEGRSITAGVPRELSRESRAALSNGNLCLRQSLFRLQYLHYENGSDSETYSADSYNPSDESADSASETDVLDEEPDESETLFCTPNTQPDTSQRRFADADQASSASRDTQAMIEREFPPARANRPGALRQVTRTRQNPRLGATFGPSIPATPRNAGSSARADNPPSVRKNTASGRGPFSHYDRSSSMTAALPEEGHLHAESDTSQDFGGGDDFWNDVDLHTESFGPGNDGESTGAEVSNSAGLAVEGSPSSASETATTTSQPVLQSVETGDRRSAAAHVDNSLFSNGLRESVGTLSKKRASSRPPMNERPSRRSLTSTSSSYASTSGSSASMSSHQTPLPAGRALPEQAQPSSSHHSSRAKEEEGTRITKHPGCINHRPCVYPPNNPTIRSSHPLIPIYSNEADGSRDMTIGQAEFIISCCSCHWANGFTQVWADAQGEFGHMSKAEVLLAYFQDDLWRAARECCPPRPGHLPCVVIDDD